MVNPRLSYGVRACLAGNIKAQSPERLGFRFGLSRRQYDARRSSGSFFRPASTLLLDEPEQRLDGGMRALLAERLAARRDGGTTIVLACHDPDLSAAVADAVVDLVPAGSP